MNSKTNFESLSFKLFFVDKEPEPDPRTLTIYFFKDIFSLYIKYLLPTKAKKYLKNFDKKDFLSSPY